MHLSATSVRLAALGALWGSSYVFIDIAVDDLPASVVAFGRQLVAAALLTPFAIAFARRGPAPLRLLVVSLVTVAGPSLLVAAGQESVTASLAAVLVATSPVLTAVFALGLDREQRSGPRGLAGIGLGLLGIVLLFGLDLRGSEDELLGGALLVLAAAGYALGPFLIRRWFADSRPLGLAAATSAVSAVVLMPGALMALPADDASSGSVLAVIALGVGGTAIGWALFYSLIATDGPRTAAVTQYLAPAFAVVLGITLLGDPVGVGVVAGLALVLAGSRLAAGRRPVPAGP